MNETDVARRNQVHQQFRQMYRETLPAVYGFLLLRTGGNRELSEDLTAETFAAAVKMYQQGQSDEVTTSWLTTVARRRLIDHWRRLAVAAKANIEPASPPKDPAAIADDLQLVIAALQQLGPDEGRALVLQHVEGYSVRDIAEILGRTEKAAESLLGRARAAFRTAFEEVDHA